MYFRCHYKNCLPFLLAILAVNGSSCALAFSQPSPSRQVAEGSRSTAISQGNVVPPPTDEDEAAEARFAQQGLLLGRLKLRTTPQSVAGRGVFFDPGADADAAAANVGDLLAFIPSHTVLTPLVAAKRYPGLKEQLEKAHKAADEKQQNDDGEGAEGTAIARQLGWPTILTAYALQALDDKDNDDWTSNIRSWQGVPASFASRPPDAYTEEELESLAKQARSSPEMIRKTLGVRFEDFRRQSRSLQQALGLPSEGDGAERWLREFGDVYAGVLSRAISLSAFAALDDQNKSSGYGVVPFQDMINHHNMFSRNNVALYSVYAMRQMAPAPKLITQRLEQTFAGKLQDPESVLDTDLCVVAIRPIVPGEEVFNPYEMSQEPLSEDRRVWKLLQYGFPME